MKLIEEEKRLIIPAFISEKATSKQLTKHLDTCKNDIGKIETEYAKVSNDRKKDDVFISIKKIIDRIDKKYYLSRSMNGEEKIRFQIRRLAKKRFELGYPPRKPEDTSYVDAINWEWIIIHCAQTYKKHIVIVTRDSDFGIQFKNDFILNDWLNTEFHERVSTKKKIIIFSRLLLALKFLGLDITKQEIDSENEIACQKSFSAD
ncbi:TPA: PIN domain-containing protein [Legionella anisa]